jgi:glutathione S-transferase
MLVLHVFGEGLELLDPSPFCVKAIMTLKIAGLEFETRRADVRKMPKHKLPVLEDGGAMIADSTFIREHIEKKFAVDLDQHLNAQQKAIAWALEKMCEDHLYWIVVLERWDDDENFKNGPATFFDGLPAAIRPMIKAIVRRQIRKSAHAHGMARHNADELAMLGARDIDAIAAVMGDGPYLMGEEPCGADATIYAFLTSAACPIFRSSLRDVIARHANLNAYMERMHKRYVPEKAKAA